MDTHTYTAFEGTTRIVTADLPGLVKAVKERLEGDLKGFGVPPPLRGGLGYTGPWLEKTRAPTSMTRRSHQPDYPNLCLKHASACTRVKTS